MSLISTADVCRLTGGHLLHGEHRPLGVVSIDSRTLKPGEAFLCLRGPHFDGHDYAEAAHEKGAAVIIVNRSGLGRVPPSVRQGHATIIAVPHTERALSLMASATRARFQGLVVGITGSSGKTTTKEMVSAVLRSRDPEGVLATYGNHNNHLGVPLTLLRIEAHHEVAVVEMGTSAPGEIGRLAQLARPDISVITAVGAAHLEELGSIAGVAREKGAIFDQVHPEGLAVLASAAPYPWLTTRYLRAALVTAGRRPGDHIQVLAPRYGVARHDTPAGARCEIRVDGEGRMPLKLQLPGLYNLDNAALAIAVGRHLGVSVPQAVRALATVTAPKLRGEIRPLTGGGRVLVDCYNANPQSMAAAIAAFEAMTRGGPRVLVLGDMLELGQGAEQAHREVGAAVAGLPGAPTLLTVGPLGAEIAAGARTAGMNSVLSVVEVAEAADILRTRVRPGDSVLLKGSRGVALEKVLPALEEIDSDARPRHARETQRP
ncbi:MAG: UDP-N-acetylmuramoyl-tripeptide--D-alanyl-D-alanine ligase [Bradymonadia bacterium]